MACGQELDVLDALFARVAGETAGWLQQVREQAPAIKAQQEEASQSRLAEMRADEMRRREAMARAQVERDRQQRIIVTVTVAIVALVFVVAFVSLVLTTR